VFDEVDAHVGVEHIFRTHNASRSPSMFSPRP
jgi:hypothetical protein